jgi:hypothetical protein
MTKEARPVVPELLVTSLAWSAAGAARQDYLTYKAYKGRNICLIRLIRAGIFAL